MKIFARMYALSTLIALTILSIGCMNVSTVEKDEIVDNADATIGYVLVGAQTQSTGRFELTRENTILEISYVPADSQMPLKLNRFQFIKSGRDFKLQSIAAGKYEIRVVRLGWGPVEIDPVQFTVAPGQITYIGDFNLTVKWSDKFPIPGPRERVFEIVDNLPATEGLLNTKYPVISKSLPIRRDVTLRKLDQTEGLFSSETK